jgi:hypothetical protein
MKPEIRIALVKEAERAKRVLSEEYSRRWSETGPLGPALRYVGAAAMSLFGTVIMTSAIRFIAEHGDKTLGALQLLLALAMILAPWYFMIRYHFNRKIQLLCEAILSVSQFDGYIAG